MNNKITKYQQTGKLLLSAVAIATLGVSSINVTSVKADTAAPSHLKAKKSLGPTASKTFVLKAAPEDFAVSKAASTASAGTKKKKANKKGPKTASKTFVLEAAPEDFAASTVSSAPGNVVVHYRDSTGKTLAPDQFLKGKVGANYTATAQNIAGYTLTTKPSNETGIFTDKLQNVTYVYDIDGAIVDGDAIGIGLAEAGAGVKVDPETKVSKTAAATGKKVAKSAPVANFKGKNATQKAAVIAGNDSEHRLPQTGADNSSHAEALGLGFLSIFGGLIGAWFSRKGKTE
ncbi:MULTISPECIES: MucBP domain-containing protein [Lactobacillus]|uniref:MucBP domain-containing protein n=1 Tax=Lactobacillus TaxID=1578 RepID=UPI00226B62E3|nr:MULTISPECIES: MucBP domain-containing protein [Lactobacillus]MCX8736700.1 MucBP domain-containing protein [Lactobacillus sp. B4026]